MYTWGAASPFLEAQFSDPATRGCWEGQRIVTAEGAMEDIVPEVLRCSYGCFEHAKQATVKIYSGQRSDFGCSHNHPLLANSSVELHLPDVYKGRAGQLTQPAQDYTKFALGASYMSTGNLKAIADLSYPFGWDLVGTSTAFQKVVHLFQHYQNMECVVTFQGSSGVDDWMDNLNYFPASFCGFSRQVHAGFADQLRRTVESSGFQSIRSKLGKCAKVTAVGHSLGGALANLFAACANTGGSSSDYSSLSWTAGSPQQMQPIA